MKRSKPPGCRYSCFGRAAPRIRASPKDRIGGPIRFSLPPPAHPRDQTTPQLGAGAPAFTRREASLPFHLETQSESDDYYTCSYADDYGETAAIAGHASQKSISAREDRLLRLVLSFFEQRIFGPIRIERLEKQLRANAREQHKTGKLAGTRMRQQISELDRKMKAQVQALEEGIEPELVSERIKELRAEKEALEGGPLGDRWQTRGSRGRRAHRVPTGAGAGGPAASLRGVRARDPLRPGGAADRDLATVLKAVADAFEKQKALPEEGSVVVHE